MGRPSITAFGLCLLCLLGSWQGMEGYAKRVSAHGFNVWEKYEHTVNCGKDFIYIRWANWNARNCRKSIPKTGILRSRCDNKHTCKFIPHWNYQDHIYINLGDPCWGFWKRLHGSAECWNPCLGINCGAKGTCKSLNNTHYECQCQRGYRNKGDLDKGVCYKSRMQAKIVLKAYESQTQDINCLSHEKIHIKEAMWVANGSGCKKSESRLQAVQGRCENKSTCKYRPHWNNGTAPWLRLGDLCRAVGETLQGVAQCWNACGGNVTCGSHGRCEVVTYNTHKCVCNKGYENAQGKPAGICEKMKYTKLIERKATEAKLETIACDEGSLIHIKIAKWSTSGCWRQDDKTEALRHRCENLQSCKFKPDYAKDYLHSLYLGDPCPKRRKYLEYEAECWNPCRAHNCKEAVCVPVTYKTHKCEKRDPRHTRTITMAKMETETEFLSCKEGELIHIQSVIWSGFVPHCNEKIDVTGKVREKCANSRECKFIPHWFQSKDTLSLASKCPKTGEYIRGEAQCWNPCVGAKCGGGKKCVPQTYNTHKCE